MNPTPDYVRILGHLAAVGTFPPGSVSQVVVAHDNDCAIWRGEACNCTPDVRVVRHDAAGPAGPAAAE
jgi:hypothetical protein